jgi:hypothetical protein
MEIPFSGQITQKDFLQAQSLHRKSSKAPIVLGGIFIVLLITSLIIAFSEPVLFGSALPILVVFAIIIVASWGIPHFQAINIWKNTKSYQKPMSGIVMSHQIDFQGAHSQGSVSWEAYFDYKRSSNMLLLYQSPNVMSIFPRTFFDDDTDWETFVKLVEDKVSAKAPSVVKKVSDRVFLVMVVIIVLLAIGGFVSSLLGWGT